MKPCRWKYIFLKLDGTVSKRSWKHPLPKNTAKTAHVPESIWNDARRIRAYFLKVESVCRYLKEMSGQV